MEKACVEFLSRTPHRNRLFIVFSSRSLIHTTYYLYQCVCMGMWKSSHVKMWKALAPERDRVGTVIMVLCCGSLASHRMVNAAQCEFVAAYTELIEKCLRFNLAYIRETRDRERMWMCFYRACVFGQLVWRCVRSQCGVWVWCIMCWLIHSCKFPRQIYQRTRDCKDWQIVVLEHQTSWWGRLF